MNTSTPPSIWTRQEGKGGLELDESLPTQILSAMISIQYDLDTDNAERYSLFIHVFIDAPRFSIVEEAIALASKEQTYKVGENNQRTRSNAVD